MKLWNYHRWMQRRRAIAGVTAGAASLMLLVGAQGARAEEHMTLVTKIDVGGNGLGAFDISFVDPTLQLYTLSDRTNASIDLIDAANDTFFGRVRGFKGVVLNTDGTANNNLSGPDGNVVVNHTQIWAGDGDMTVKVIDIAQQRIIKTISTGGKLRADEMAWDPRHHILAVANDADTPPFVTLIDTDTYTVLAHINFDGGNGSPRATGGIEQTQWSPTTGMFYTSVPELNGNAAVGGVAIINPLSKTVTGTYLVHDCQPAGLALGPNNRAVLGCAASFGSSPHILTQSIVIDITNGEVQANVTQVGGSDQVWYDRGANHYYMAARSNVTSTGTANPILGVIDANENVFDGGPATSTTAHSVAANQTNRQVFVPIGKVPANSPPGTDPTNPCPTTGCIAVYVPTGLDGDEFSMQGQ